MEGKVLVLTLTLSIPLVFNANVKATKLFLLFLKFMWQLLGMKCYCSRCLFFP